MEGSPGFQKVIRFGVFEWDGERAELRKRGVRLKLSGQPLEVFKILVGHSGRVVSREELRRELWGEETFVDFEQGLNTAIARLRHTLGDSAENPCFIETAPGRGYRFICEVAAPQAEATPPALRPSGVDRRTWLAGCFGLAAGAAGAYFAIGHESKRGVSHRQRRFIVSAPPAPELLPSTISQDLAISPDGRRIVYRCDSGGGARLYTRALDRIEGRVLPETDVFNPFFSSDSAQIGYYAFGSRSLMRTSILGGPASRVADALEFLAGACWSPDDRIVFATMDPSLGILRVAATGGRLEMLTRPRRGENHVMPDLLPGGRGVLFTVLPAVGYNAPPYVAVLESGTGQVRALTPGSHPRYAAPGYIVYLLDDNLLAVRFDERRLTVEGSPATVLAGIEASMGIGQYSFSRSGALLVSMGGGGARRELVWVDGEGREETLPAAARAYTYPRISPRGRRIALNTRETNHGRIFIWDSGREQATPLAAATGASDIYPVWAADGQRLLYESSIGPRHQLRMAAIESGRPGTPVAGGLQLRAPYFLSPDGAELVYAWQGPDPLDSQVALWKTSLKQDADPVKLLAGARNADLSPDGRFIVYQGDETGRFEIYLRSFPDIHDHYVKASASGGIQPVWSPRNDKIFYIEPGSPSRLMSVAVEAGSGRVMSRPRPLFEWSYYQAELGRTYDISRPDGERFLAVRKGDSQSGAPRKPRVDIVLDWFDALESAFQPLKT